VVVINREQTIELLKRYRYLPQEIQEINREINRCTQSGAYGLYRRWRFDTRAWSGSWEVERL